MGCQPLGSCEVSRADGNAARPATFGARDARNFPRLPLVCLLVTDQLVHLGLLDDDAIVLDADALKIAAADRPDVPLAPYLDVLADITDRLIVAGADAMSAADRAAVLQQVFVEEFGFRGDSDTYDDPDNADLIRVIDRRRGLPVSLGILYVAAARRLGWSADALNTPGHVLVRIGSPLEPVLIDPFHGGGLVGPSGLASLLARMLGPHAAATTDHLAALSNRAVLVRLMLNQASRAEAAGDARRALHLYRRMTDIAPSNGHAWWERARLELMRGDVHDARSSLSAMLEVTREPALRAHIFSALDTLAGRGA
jgi:regulator of sirC expression with transglutaminase-like and TPR domain